MIEKVTIKDKVIMERILGEKSESLSEYIFELPQDEPIILIGGVNGSGKSTLLNTMHYTPPRIRLNCDEEKKLKEFKEMVKLSNDNTEISFWSNSRDNMRNAKNMDEIFADDEDGINLPLFLGAKKQSEGECLLVHFTHFINKKIENNSKLENPKELIFIIDEIDSGLSDDVIFAVMRYMKRMNNEHGVKFICSCNSYMMVREVGKLYPVSWFGQGIKIDNYEKWFAIIQIENHNKLNKANYLAKKKDKNNE